jgi:hypothetical protein
MQLIQLDTLLCLLCLCQGKTPDLVEGSYLERETKVRGLVLATASFLRFKHVGFRSLGDSNASHRNHHRMEDFGYSNHCRMDGASRLDHCWIDDAGRCDHGTGKYQARSYGSTHVLHCY